MGREGLTFLMRGLPRRVSQAEETVMTKVLSREMSLPCFKEDKEASVDEGQQNKRKAVKQGRKR